MATVRKGSTLFTEKSRLFVALFLQCMPFSSLSSVTAANILQSRSSVLEAGRYECSLDTAPKAQAPQPGLPRPLRESTLRETVTQSLPSEQAPSRVTVPDVISMDILSSVGLRGRIEDFMYRLRVPAQSESSPSDDNRVTTDDATASFLKDALSNSSLSVAIEGELYEAEDMVRGSKLKDPARNPAAAMHMALRESPWAKASQGRSTRDMVETSVVWESASPFILRDISSNESNSVEGESTSQVVPNSIIPRDDNVGADFEVLGVLDGGEEATFEFLSEDSKITGSAFLEGNMSLQKRMKDSDAHWVLTWNKIADFEGLTLVLNQEKIQSGSRRWLCKPIRQAKL